jgi:hypothetical protein
MVEDDIKQTRCTTCDAEHPYKGGKAPRRRKKDAPTALYDEVLAGLPEVAGAPPQLTSPESRDSAEPRADANEEGAPDEVPAEESVQRADAMATDEPVVEVEEGPVHRPLIRAQLPRPEGQKDARPLPDFTVRHAGRGNGHFRGDARMKPRGGSGPNGNRGQGGSRFAGARPGQGRGGGRGPGGGFRSPQQPRHGGKKRSR